MRRGGKNSHINSLGFRDYSRKRNNLYLYRLKIAGSSRAEDPCIKEWLLNKPKMKRAVGRGCEVAGGPSFFPRGFNADRRLCTFLSVFTA